MQFSEDELREALRRKDPGERFTKEVMARVAEGKPVPALRSEKRFRQLLRGLTLRPVLAGAVAAILVLAVSIGVVEHRREQAKRGEAAKQQALLALRITQSKLNHVLGRVKPPAGPAGQERTP